jgi:hypothetical protein
MLEDGKTSPKYHFPGHNHTVNVKAGGLIIRSGVRIFKIRVQF